jgi:hypothetical protein
VLRRAVAVAPDAAGARYALARTLLLIGKADEGRQHLAEFQRLQAAILAQRHQKFETERKERTKQLRDANPGR